MRTEDLIDGLARDVTRVPRFAARDLVVKGLGAGGLVTALLLLPLIRLRPDLTEALTTASFWMKAAYTLSITVLAAALTIRLSRPDAARPSWRWALAAPLAAIAFAAVEELAATPADEWMSLWLGQSWWQCPLILLAMAAPILAGLFWTLRRLAPAQPRFSGAIAGLAAGAGGGAIYVLHCPETSATFVATWYTLGMMLPASIGALLGPKLLKW